MWMRKMSAASANVARRIMSRLTFEFTRSRRLAKPAAASRVQRRVGRHRSTELNDPPRCGRGRIARIGGSRRLDEQQVRLFLGDGAVLYPFRDDEQFTWTKRNITLAHANVDTTLENKEEVIRVVVRVPDELTFDLDDHQIVAIELADDTGLPVTFEGSELFREIDGGHGVQGT
jgi:hypothetical protein